MKILLTNDDGISAEGLESLATALADIAEVVVVAPDREASATGHSITLERPVRLKEWGENRYSVDGTPTDCVMVALVALMANEPPDLLVSGINRGQNMGDDVTYSGTVGAAMEGHLHGIPSIAVSQSLGHGMSFPRSAEIVRDLIQSLLKKGLEKNLLLNVNVPPSEFKGFRWTSLDRRRYVESVVEQRDPRGRRYYWIAGRPVWDGREGGDSQAVAEGFVSITPLQLDLTDFRRLEESEKVSPPLRLAE